MELPETPTTFAITRGNLKYIQYHGIYDREELYDIGADPTEMTNLIDDPAHLQDKITLRAALYQQMANNKGKHMIPYTARQAIGSVRRMKGGTGAAPFPEEWLVEPNRTDRLDDIMPDTMAKGAAKAAGKPFVNSPTVAEQLKKIPKSKGPLQAVYPDIDIGDDHAALRPPHRICALSKAACS
jgi:hypothetical protein